MIKLGLTAAEMDNSRITMYLAKRLIKSKTFWCQSLLFRDNHSNFFLFHLIDVKSVKWLRDKIEKNKISGIFDINLI